MDIAGGSFTVLRAYNSSTVDMSSGHISKLYTYDSSIVDISGGSYDNLEAYGMSTITLYGYDFRVTGGLILHEGQVFGTGVLTGKWFGDEATWTLPISVHDTGATIFAIPEPASLALLGLGITGLLLQRQTYRERARARARSMEMSQ